MASYPATAATGSGNTTITQAQPASSMSDSIRRSTRTRMPISYPTQPLQNKARSRKRKAQKSNEKTDGEVQSSNEQIDAEIPVSDERIGQDIIGTLLNAIGPDCSDSEQTDEEDWEVLGAAALRQGFATVQEKEATQERFDSDITMAESTRVVVEQPTPAERASILMMRK